MKTKTDKAPVITAEDLARAREAAEAAAREKAEAEAKEKAVTVKLVFDNPKIKIGEGLKAAVQLAAARWGETEVLVHKVVETEDYEYCVWHGDHAGVRKTFLEE